MLVFSPFHNFANNLFYILDQILVNDLFALFDVNVDVLFSASDHNVVTFKLLHSCSLCTSDYVPAFPNFDFRDNNWYEINGELAGIDLV